MAVLFERFTSTPLGAVTLVDEFARLRGTRGPFPTPVGPVRLTLVEEITDDGPVLLDPPVRVRAEVNPTGVYLFINEVSVGDGPKIRFPEGVFRLRVESDFYQPLERFMTFPVDLAQVETLRLMPGTAYPFPDLTSAQNALTLLYGTLFEVGDGRPVAGAEVRIVAPANDWPFNRCVTGPKGDWVVAMPFARAAPPLALTLRFAPPGGSSFDVSGVQVQPGTVNSLPQTALRGRVLDTAGAPIRRARLTVSVQPGEAFTAADGQWSFYLSLLQPDATAVVTARAPGGNTQAQEVDIRNRATVVVPAFRIAIN